MRKKLIRFISLITFGFMGVSTSSAMSSDQFDAVQSDEINQQQRNKAINKSLFPGQCEDSIDGARLLTDELDQE